ncbi:hypothetical protein HWN40_07390 [Methanolobus zinderi]|uniref:ATP-binding protein n=1 Tax=Methanolobus zinderi TaxID=536044 RepID=A0A7D5EEI0_9EURY|nr:hypothetical protein [Methanolobus zinderi]QLC50076.1 hypothetical protein HWN40_07390 [Methanolobus zinderi]
MTEEYLRADLKGKIRNLGDFKSEALLPVFEAVVNSIHSIEDNNDIHDGLITVKVVRDNVVQVRLSDSDTLKEEKIIKAFGITDNGIGFTEENYSSFLTSDSTYKLQKGGKGVGRFTWLKAFDNVKITSVYLDKQKQKQFRSFDFTIDNFISNHFKKSADANAEHKTTVLLKGFKESYRTEPSAYKTTEKIAQRILEHCLVYYINDIAPRIIVKDDDDSFDLNMMFLKIKNNIVSEDIRIYDDTYRISHLKLYNTYQKAHKIVYCAHNRDVDGDKLDKYLGTPSQLDDDDNKFVYSVYVSGSYLDKYVNSSRRGFELPKNGIQVSLDNKKTYPLNIIRDHVIEKSKEYLESYLTRVNEIKKERIANYVASTPSLKSVPHYCPEVLDEIDVNASDAKINEALFKHKGVAEFNIRNDTEKLLKTQYDSVSDIEDDCKQLCNKLHDFQKDDLAQYLIKRKKILEVFEKKLELREDGKYELESIIHDILFPRRTETNHMSYEDHNLWIIDDVLSYHQYAASDKPLRDFSDSDSDLRPDMIIFEDVNDDKIANAVSVIELKRPQRKDYDKSPVVQMYEILEDIKNKKIKQENGRDININDSTKFYCFAICDINDSVKKDAEERQFHPLKDGMGYYLYHGKFNAYVEILSYDKLISSANKKHRAFFDKLGL